jgi:hypothetical protein
MNINLQDVLTYINGYDERDLIETYMKVFYPNELRERIVLMAILDSGVIYKFIDHSEIPLAKIDSYVQMIENQYGLEHELVNDGMTEWIKSLLENDMASIVDFDYTYDDHDDYVNYRNYNFDIIDLFGYSIKPCNGDGLKILKYHGNEEEKLFVPNWLDGKKVLCIGEEAYKDLHKVRKITIGNGIKCIGKNAFSGCEQLNDVVIPNSVETIEDCAFQDCTSLDNVILPGFIGGSLKNVGVGAFHNCPVLERTYFERILQDFDYYDSYE